MLLMRSATFSRIAALLVLFSFIITTIGQVPPPFPVKRSETPDDWRRDGWSMIDSAKRVKYKYRKAKNVILFIGDGMGVSTLTAARILEGQLRGESGEENRLSFERFPFTALSKTYSVTQQTSDSAPTMSAIITGVKTNAGMISVNSNVRPDDYTTVEGNEAKTLVEYAEESGRSTGIISTARLTHATPAACYAHSPKRGWEDDTDMLEHDKDALDGGFPDIARQFVEFKYGDGPEVAFGGGRAKFMSSAESDPEYPHKKGDRSDGRDLIAEWQAKHPGSRYVWDKKGFDAIDPKKTTHVLGMFEPSHMQYEHERANDKAGEPSLTEMTTKAIDILSKNKKGYFLMVEGGRIDHAHHDGNAFHALTETIELSNAVRAAASKVDLEDTLIVVTADHSHTFVISGYPYRGNNILGLVREGKADGTAADKYRTAKDGKPYTTLGYTNGLGARVNEERAAVTQKEATDHDFLQPALVPLGGETHGGEDVAIFATGVNAFLFRGSMEENWTFYVIADAMRLGRK